ncbi:hypothetical protein EPI10_016013 [Gossypium australe]|uniref:Uncharacterized protein n=1 Tax=Gossypium australe TaxID=47621 RepID=A0A5B6VMG3_9ROSI|nr:hypothetical protein EPI10_016013 [Gossypium australe]
MFDLLASKSRASSFHWVVIAYIYSGMEIFQSSIQMALHNVSYGRRCRTPLCWSKLRKISLGQN